MINKNGIDETQYIIKFAILALTKWNTRIFNQVERNQTERKTHLGKTKVPGYKHPHRCHQSSWNCNSSQTCWTTTTTTIGLWWFLPCPSLHLSLKYEPVVIITKKKIHLSKKKKGPNCSKIKTLRPPWL